ncbi:helix-turn-helix domain-containing protein, partial [Flavobacterium cupreum]
MANKRLDMRNILQLLRLYTQGVSKLQISRQLGLSRNTVKKYIESFHQNSFTYQELSGLSNEDLEELFDGQIKAVPEKNIVLESLFPTIEKELKRVGVTRQLLWEEYRENHPDGYSYSQFC